LAKKIKQSGDKSREVSINNDTSSPLLSGDYTEEVRQQDRVVE